MQEPVVVVLGGLDKGARQIVAKGLSGTGAVLHSTSESREAIGEFQRLGGRIVALSVDELGPESLESVDQLLAADPGLEVVLVAADYSERMAIAAIKRGASDILRSPLSQESVTARLRPLVVAIEERRGIVDHDLELLRRFEFNGMIGRSPVMLDLFTRIRRVAPHFRSALISGPAGSGKAVAARALHALSASPDDRFVVYDCADSSTESLARNAGGKFVEGALYEQELSDGHDGRTLYLHEVSDLPLEQQSVLVRILVSTEFRPGGRSRTAGASLRVVAATSRDLQLQLKAGKLREDLYYRLTEIGLEVPPLEDRKEDLLLLVRHFLRRLSQRFQKTIRGLTRRAQIALSSHSWPGNVRELENVLAQACLMAEGNVIDVHHLAIHAPARTTVGAVGTPLISLREAERRHAEQVLSVLGGNKARAAEVLEISRAKLYRMLANPNSD